MTADPVFGVVGAILGQGAGRIVYQLDEPDAGPVHGGRSRLAGHDVTPGHDQLHHYWTKDPEGLAKWAASPHPFTTLVAHLVKYMSPDKAKAAAAKWHFEVFGIWPGHKAGKNKFGPG